MGHSWLFHNFAAIAKWCTPVVIYNGISAASASILTYTHT